MVTLWLAAPLHELSKRLQNLAQVRGVAVLPEVAGQRLGELSHSWFVQVEVPGGPEHPGAKSRYI